MYRSAALTKRLRDWPALMKPTTARDYLDGMAADKFAAIVVPHLEARSVGGELRYTRRSLDDWIDRGERADHKGAVQGCGEFNPVLILSKQKSRSFEISGDKEGRNAANEPNRRVLAFLGTPGRLLRVRRDCTTTAIADGLPAPTSVVIGPGHDAYVTVKGTSPGIGRVLRFDLGASHATPDDETGDD